MSLIPVQAGFEICYDGIALAGVQSYEIRLLNDVRRVAAAGHNALNKLLYGGYSYQVTVRRLLPEHPEVPTWPLGFTVAPFTLTIRRKTRLDTLEGCMLLSLTEQCQHGGCAVEELVCVAKSRKVSAVSD